MSVLPSGRTTKEKPAMLPQLGAARAGSEAKPISTAAASAAM